MLVIYLGRIFEAALLLSKPIMTTMGGRTGSRWVGVRFERSVVRSTAVAVAI